MEKKRRREGEKKKKRKRKRKEGDQASQDSRGMETTLGMDFVWLTWNFKALYG